MTQGYPPPISIYMYLIFSVKNKNIVNISSEKSMRVGLYKVNHHLLEPRVNAESLTCVLSFYRCRPGSNGRIVFIWHFRLKVRTAVSQAANGIAKFSSVTIGKI